MHILFHMLLALRTVGKLPHWQDSAVHPLLPVVAGEALLIRHNRKRVVHLVFLPSTSTQLSTVVTTRCSLRQMPSCTRGLCRKALRVMSPHSRLEGTCVEHFGVLEALAQVSVIRTPRIVTELAYHLLRQPYIRA